MGSWACLPLTFSFPVSSLQTVESLPLRDCALDGLLRCCWTFGLFLSCGIINWGSCEHRVYVTRGASKNFSQGQTEEWRCRVSLLGLGMFTP